MKAEDNNVASGFPPLKLQCRPDSWRNVYWKEDPIMKEFLEKGVDIQDENVRHLIKELDRRFVQLWDKRQDEKDTI